MAGTRILKGSSGTPSSGSWVWRDALDHWHDAFEKCVSVFQEAAENWTSRAFSLSSYLLRVHNACIVFIEKVSFTLENHKINLCHQNFFFFFFFFHAEPGSDLKCCIRVCIQTGGLFREGQMRRTVSQECRLTILWQGFFNLGWWTGAFWTGAVKPLFIWYSECRCFSEKLRTNGWFGCFFHGSYSIDLVISAIMTPIFHGYFRLDFYFVNVGFCKLFVFVSVFSVYICRQTR